MIYTVDVYLHAARGARKPMARPTLSFTVEATSVARALDAARREVARRVKTIRMSAKVAMPGRRIIVSASRAAVAAS